VNLTGDELVVKKYERLSPLNVVQKPLGGTHKYSFDCLVCLVELTVCVCDVSNRH
jgi:hypothetical protein